MLSATLFIVADYKRINYICSQILRQCRCRGRCVGKTNQFRIIAETIDCHFNSFAFYCLASSLYKLLHLGSEDGGIRRNKIINRIAITTHSNVV